MNPNPHRRWLQFSLRTLLIVMTLLAMALGTAMLPAERQRRAVRTVRGLGGSVSYADPLAEESLFVSQLRVRLGRDYFDVVKEIDLVGTPASDQDLAQLRRLTHVERLFLDDTQVTDAGLENLQGLKQTQMLSLNNTRISDTGVAYLLQATNLRTLWLNRTGVTDATLARLHEHSQIGELYLDGTQVTDAGLPHLQSMSQLRKLSLAGTRVTEAGVKELKKSLPRCYISYN